MIPPCRTATNRQQSSRKEISLGSSAIITGRKDGCHMPLRDHFRPPVWKQASWEGFHGMWPAVMVQHLIKVLPEDFTAEPRVHLGGNFEIDVCAYEGDANAIPRSTPAASNG